MKVLGETARQYPGAPASAANAGNKMLPEWAETMAGTAVNRPKDDRGEVRECSATSLRWYSKPPDGHRRKSHRSPPSALTARQRQN